MQGQAGGEVRTRGIGVGDGMKRILTAAVGVPLALLAIFRLPSGWFFAVALLVFELAALELVLIGRRWAPLRALSALLLLMPLVAAALAGFLPVAAGGVGPPPPAMLLACVLSLVGGGWVVLARVPSRQALPAMGIVAFGTLYLALPTAVCVELQRTSPRALLLLVALVWCGDTAAYYVGSRYGRRSLAPELSPRKTWEGALASIGGSLAAAVAWGLWLGSGVRPGLLLLAVVVSLAGQFGDLVESAIKRGAEVKDSGSMLPGHGGFLDRCDALVFAAPVFWALLAFLGGHGG